MEALAEEEAEAEAIRRHCKEEASYFHFRFRPPVTVANINVIIRFIGSGL